MKKIPKVLLLLAVIFMLSSCSSNAIKIHPEGNIAYLLVSDKVTDDYEYLAIKDGLLINKSSGQVICGIQSKPTVFLFSDFKSQVVALPMSRQQGSKLGIQGLYFYVVDTITDDNILSIKSRQEAQVIEAFTHPGQKINLSARALVSYVPDKILGELKISKKEIQFNDGKPTISESKRSMLWPMLELIVTALMIFFMARTVTINCLGIEDWKQRHKLSYKKWSKVSTHITAGLMIILFAFELTDVVWGTTSPSEGVLASALLIFVNAFICAVVGTLLKALLTLPYQAITWFVFTALIVWGVKVLVGHVWQIYLPFTGYFAWLIWLKIYRKKMQKSTELIQRLA